MLITKQVLEEAQRENRRVTLTMPSGKEIWGKIELITPEEAIGVTRYSGGAVKIVARDDRAIDETWIDIDVIICTEVWEK